MSSSSGIRSSGYTGGMEYATTMTSNQIFSQNSPLYLNYASTSNTLINVNGGNVGIGTIAPSAALHVSGSTTAPLNVDGNAASYIKFLANGVGKGFIGYYSGTAGLAFLNSGGTAVNFLVTEAGNAGIGTTAPGTTLQVSSSTGIRSSMFWSGQQRSVTIQHDQIYSTNTPLYLNYSSTSNTIINANGGDVGIGTSSPNARLEVAHSGSANAGAIRIGDPSTIGNNTGIYGRTSGVFTLGAAGGDIVLDTNYGSGERIRVKHSTGNVGIGTSSPFSALGVNTGEQSTFVSSTAFGLTLQGGSTNNYWRGIDFRTTGSLPVGRIGVQYTGAGSFMSFGTSNNYSLGITNQAMTINNNALIGMGTITPRARLDVNGDIIGSSHILMDDYNTANGAGKMFGLLNYDNIVYVRRHDTGTAQEANIANIDLTSGVYTTTSDIRRKRDITPYSGGLETVEQLKPVNFRWKADGSADIGFIAQEVEKVLPVLVKTDPDGYKSLSYAQIVVPLVSAVHELKAANDNLRTELIAANDNLMSETAALKAENEALRQRLDVIEHQLHGMVR